MASILIRNLDPEVKERLRRRAKRHGRSMEAEVRLIVELALVEDADTGVTKAEPHWVDRVRRHIEEEGPIELDIPARSEPRPALDFDQ